MLLSGGFLLPALAAGPPADIASLAAEIATMKSNANHVWTLTAAALVLLMQAGFLLLEAGLVRSKNSINVAQKNAADFFVSSVCFAVFGFALMFGPSVMGLFGAPSMLTQFEKLDDWTYTFFAFQVVFAGTAATIVSGAVAERMKYSVYLIASAVVGLVIYPVFGHWAWGKALLSDSKPWLAEAGFIDFAGSTVVHSVGAWISLAGIIVLGARIGRFDENGRPRPIHGHSHVLAATGAMLLLVGWIGFNAGSTTAASGAIGKIAANTILSGAVGGVAAMLIGRIYDGNFLTNRLINGLLAGLVGITAGCDAVDIAGAAIIGLLCGLVVVAVEEFVLRVMKLDDVAGVIGVHGVSGVIGTLLLPFLAMPDKLGGNTPWGQFAIQAQGAAAAFVWAFGTGYVMFKVLDMVMGIRVSAEDELRGLNASEHGAALGTGALQEALHRITQVERDLTQRLDDKSGDEAAEIASVLNPFLAEFQTLLRSISGHAGRISSASGSLGSLSAEVLSDATAIARGTGDLGGAADRLHRDSADAVRQAGMIAEGARGVNAAATTMNTRVGELAQRIDELSGSVSEIAGSSQSAMRIAESARGFAAKSEVDMRELNAASAQIADIVALIEEIAAKTNLLALNATIEAARAGEAGRGFSVVATEVKGLAEETRRATHDVRQRVEAIRDGARRAGEGFGGLRNVLGEIDAAMATIAEAAEGQARLARLVGSDVAECVGQVEIVASSVGRMTGGLDTISGYVGQVAGSAEKTAGSVREMGAVAARGTATARQLDSRSGELTEVARDLGEVAAHYKVA